MSKKAIEGIFPHQFFHIKGQNKPGRSSIFCDFRNTNTIPHFVKPHSLDARDEPCTLHFTCIGLIGLALLKCRVKLYLKVTSLFQEMLPESV